MHRSTLLFVFALVLCCAGCANAPPGEGLLAIEAGWETRPSELNAAGVVWAGLLSIAFVVDLFTLLPFALRGDEVFPLTRSVLRVGH